MHPFRAGDSTYKRSIAIDASTIGNVTVTVAVSSTRINEVDILDSIYNAAEGYDFYPFRNKSNDINNGADIGLFEKVISANDRRLKATAHFGDDKPNSERIEAVQSAILVEELQTPDTLIILDGNENKAKRFGHAISGISSDIPPIATCIQAELYYPTSLLADLCASYLAHEIDRLRHCSEAILPAPVSKKEYNNHWGKAYSSMVNLSNDIRIEPLQQYHAGTVGQRVNCWFKGYMGGGNSHPVEQSVRPIVQYARSEGYEKLAAKLSEI